MDTERVDLYLENLDKLIALDRELPDPAGIIQDNNIPECPDNNVQELPI